MFSARTVIRALRAPVSRSVSRTISTVPQKSVLASTWKSSALIRQPRLIAPFSTTFRAFEKQGVVDEELALKLESELNLEKEVSENDEIPQIVADFIQNSSFKINDKPGQEEVELIRKFGDETIRVVFSISDLNALSEDGLNEDALFDEEEPSMPRNSMQSGGAQSAAGKDNGNIAVADDANEDEDEFGDEDEEPSFPARVNVTIEKPNQGALQVEAIAQDGMMVIENVFYHKNATLATAQTADADWERRGVYAGPPFGNLDEDLQVLLERYLDERGINTSLALFIPDYIDYKEQKEYLSWLENVKNFVSA
ncbi:mitochondrial glycoprotein [Tricharina praecox]|uniref:mitochondrial glycoprotein n=1 Tax=Tricharina praecox TaxID=43433 RepID=UPI00221F264B|nr:mitochondrial glycoprotein [Tricharina praecox]XP_051343658.1 mitochondrial glycoprotein [Tricharina praecox]KAI5841286.1 mitochondrial glycoprotein [Tricharina praecox]KAI5857912.1 mitochondrial glycoprotein [Tricharina praecox]